MPENTTASIVEVAVPAPVHGCFSYKSSLPVSPGSRVLVPFHRQHLIGIVTKLRSQDQDSAPLSYRLRNIEEVIDSEPVFSPALLKLAHWLATYYCHPIGEVFRTMLPASINKAKRPAYYLSALGSESLFGEEGRPSSEDQVLTALRQIFERDQIITKRTLAQKIKYLNLDLTEKTLLDSGYLKYGKKSQNSARSHERSATAKTANFDIARIAALSPRLGDDQNNVFARICNEGVEADTAQGRLPFLLRGVTGSGKTEIYLQTITKVIQKGLAEHSGLAQSLVLVPEISLTPQMTDVFIKRFGSDMVAVVHSQMSDQLRWKELQKIRNGEALILIGPRSAIFASFKNLKLIVVDEEHDLSYKQHSGLLYNARDVAVVRGKWENATVLLGSATPSLESFANTLDGKYKLLELPRRISGLDLPKVEVVNARPAHHFGQRVDSRMGEFAYNPGQEDVGIPLDDSILVELKKNIELKQQSIVLVNRRGFAYYLFSVRHNKALPCPNCSVSLTLHRRISLLHCHYCDYRVSTVDVMKQADGDVMFAVGYGSEKVEGFLQREIPGARIGRLDSDATSQDNEHLTRTLREFRAGNIDILVGTQMLAKGHDFPNVTLMVLLEVDQLLDFPDFRAAEKTFQLMVQAAGRAGRAELPGRVLIQCSRTNDPTIQSALAQDFASFSTRELARRKAAGFPPYSRMALIEICSSNKDDLIAFATRVSKWFEMLATIHPELTKLVKVLGPVRPPIEQLRSRFRRSLIVSSPQVAALQHVVGQFHQAFLKTEGDIRVKIDVDPQQVV